MKPDPSIPLPAECDRCQQQLSEIADSGEPLPPELRAHLAGCAACTQFADQWLAGPPAALARPVSAVPGNALRERILGAAAPAKIVQFPGPTVGFPSRHASLGKVAAGVALAGLAYWLLDPTVSPVPNRPTTAAVPTLTQGLLQMEDGTKREQRALQAALVDSSRQVSGDVAWSVSALEL